MDDAALITAHLSGNVRAIGTLMARHERALMGFLMARVGTDAEDVYQETWIKVCRALHAYQERGSFRAYLFQTARRLVIDHHRRAGARITIVPPVETDPVGALRPDDALQAQQMLTVCEGALAKMRPEVAEVVRLRITQGIPFKEIARRQSVPLNTALTRMHRGLRQLRAALVTHQLIDPQPGATLARGGGS